MHRIALRFSGLLIIVLTILRVPDYVSSFLVAPERSFVLFLAIAFLPLTLSLVAGILLWRYADRLSRVIDAAQPERNVQIRELSSQRLWGIGVALVGVFLLVEAGSDLAFWIGRYFQLKKAMPHVEVELGEDFMSMFSTAFKILLAVGLIVYGRKAGAGEPTP